MAKHKHKHRDAIILRPHHRKPYRIHHLGLLSASLLLVVLLAIQLGIVLGHDQAPPAPKPVITSAPSRLVEINSGYGYTAKIDNNLFSIVASDVGSKPIPMIVESQKLDNNLPISNVKIRAKPGAVTGRSLTAQLSIEVNPDKAAYSVLQSNLQNKDLSAGQVSKMVFPTKTSTPQLTVSTISSSADMLNGTVTHKTIYKYTDRQTGGSSYAIVWNGVVGERAYAVELSGLVGGPSIPSEYIGLINSLKISSDQAVLGASTTIFAAQKTSFSGKLDYKYLSDAVSPAVVQIFHTVCGVLTLKGQALGDSACVTVSGSGFMATQDGYIATNGHVVVFSAKDALANLVMNNPNIMQDYFRYVGLNDSQIAASKKDIALQAALISKIYDYTDSELKFSNMAEMNLVALGRDQPNLKVLAGVKSAEQLNKLKQDTATIKQAKLIGYNYSAQDKFIAIVDPIKGYSSSDVALLKVNVRNAPAIPIQTGPVLQNQKIVLMGFPTDASNPLIDNSFSDVTVTDGVISAIRQAAGNKGQLYQSDVDASHGNSGGPAIDDQGHAIGLLTYRYVDAGNGNSPKSYIRDISDFVELAKDEAVTINSDSTVQKLWLSGLEKYSNRHYSAALKDFNQVYSLYPSHRLVGSYMLSSKKAIVAGEDVKDVPVRLLMFGLVVSLTAVGVTVFVIVRHHGFHRVYQVSQRDGHGHQRAVINFHQ